MSRLPDPYPEIIDPLIAQARRFLEDGESLEPFAFVGNLARQAILAVLLRTDSEAGKDASAARIRELAEQHQADFIFVITEAWALSSDDAPRFEEILKEYGSIGASPYRIDCVSFALETDMGTWVAQAPIAASDRRQGGRTFESPRFTYFDKVEGRLSALLPGGVGRPRTLH